MFHIKIQNSKKGIILYFAMLIMSALLGISLGLSTIIITNIKVIREIGNSVIAFHAADTGIEQAMYILYQQGTSPPFNFQGYLDLNKNGTQDPKEPTYEMRAFLPGEGCSAIYYCLKSAGFYKETKRTIEASY